MFGAYLPCVVVEPSCNSATPANAVIAVGYMPSLAAQLPKRDWVFASQSSPPRMHRLTSFLSTACARWSALNKIAAAVAARIAHRAKTCRVIRDRSPASDIFDARSIRILCLSCDIWVWLNRESCLATVIHFGLGS